MPTFVAKPGEVDKKWILIDANGLVVGRLAALIATRLKGKHKAIYTPHVDCGDNIVVVNAEKVHVTGRKEDQKTYHRHSGYPGGLKTIPYKRMMANHPDRILRFAVKGMLPKTRLGRQQIVKLKIYAGPTHPHSAQSRLQRLKLYRHRSEHRHHRTHQRQ